MKTQRLLRVSPTAGYSLLEVLLASTLFVVVFMASITLIEHDRRLSRSALHISRVELMAQNMLFELEQEVANAFGENPVAVAPLGLAASAETLQLDSTLGFPPQGSLVIDRGNDDEERVSYNGLEATQVLLANLTRGQQCSVDVAHDVQAEVIWAGLAEPLEQQDPAPDPDDYDGISMEAGGPVYFRGDGTGFSYRVPVDPGGGLDFLDGDELQWGAEVPGVGPTLDGWNAVYFRAREQFSEIIHGDDINGDGDTDDIFDIGQIRKVTWDTSDPNVAPRDIGLGPTNVIQERCNHGGDLDNDQFDDPIFLWDRSSNELHVRLFLLGTSIANVPILRQMESVMFLRNEPEL
ncbi:MAG: hypothetical protein AAF682_27135 [Planctomycetota bacterium]